MPKMFFDVFPALDVNAEMKKLLTDVEVTKVGMNHEQTKLRVYLLGTHLIHKKNIYALEKAIADQIFKGKQMEVKVIEKYQLSGQYNARTLMDIYKDSILEELRNYSLMEYGLLRSAKIEFTDDSHLNLTMENTIIAQTRSHDIQEFLEKIFCERCGMDLHVNMIYEEPKESRHRKNSEKQIQQEILNIVNRINLKNDEEGGAPVPASSESAEKKPVATSGSESAKPAQKVEKPAKNDAKAPFDAGKTAKKPFEGGGNRGGFRKKSDDPDVIYGRDIEEGEITPIEKIMGEMGEVTIRCKIMTLDTREIRNEKTIIMLTVTDFTDSIGVKIFTRTEDCAELLPELKPGAFLKIRGVTTIDKFDSELTIASIVGMKKIPNFTSMRMDTSPEKRVELHCHTKMSDMDGVSECKDIVKRAMKWGHKAIAITDHGDVQAFPDANHAFGPDDDFKVIYGMEAYLVDDLKDIVEHSKGQSLDATYVVFDLETTGFSPEKNKIIEIGAVKVVEGKITDRFSHFVNPEVPIPYEIEELTSIRDDMVMDAPKIEEILPEFMKFCEGAVMVAHNADFDMSFIKKNCERQGLPCDFTVIDTVALARYLMPQLNRFKLDTIAKALNIVLANHHRAVDDAGCTAEIFVKFITMLRERGMEDLDAVNAQASSSPETIMKMPTYHAIILATNDIGRINLYRLVSMSHLTYYHSRPRIPKSEFVKYREGLLLGSACEAGELYRAILGSRPEEEIIRIVKFYDYLEIQPLGNNKFMLADEKSSITSFEELQDINKYICELGEQFNKLVVATCDVHFLDPEDEVYRRIIMAGKGFKDADDQAPLYLRTTEEMLQEFAYLGSSKAEEVVITNTNKIANMCERIAPVRPDKCPPVIENSDQMLRDICYTKAHSMYGEVLPAVVKERLDRELNSIISNGYAVMYIIAQKLVWKSNEDGYLVGSRGSVGSSFAATMSGITEVNPLQAHYRCEHCKYSDFDSPEVKAFSGRGGCDMPDKICPVCGKRLTKDGFDIPFETFLGFKGNKEPDIDLNFSGEYQSKAHAYCEVIFGYGQTFRAGTIGTLADKTAFGYIKNYYEERGIRKRVCEINRIVQGCVGVRRTTGQHPGGIIVLPVGEDINSFTPVQHPANDMTTATVTTHFDYHSIDHNLLKLDILGHDDPTMIRMLQDLTGLDPQTIPLDDPTVMSLFMNTSALGVTPEEINGIPLGCLGIPEFGTEFAMQMVIDAKPKEFSDLIRISGLSHGTDVWLGNAQTLIEEGKATISTAICTRDDIMIYLINMGLDSELSFTIMESVRKGKGLKPDWEKEMEAHNVPDWYIWSCKKIKYMFPKAHAAAYVMMAWRIAYCKVFYPLAYYAAYFSIRATGFDYEIMCQGKERLEYFYKDYTKRKDSLSNKEKDVYRDMKIAQEMYARGFEFLPIDIYRSHPDRFQIIDGKLLPALNTIEGMGDNAAIAVAEAAKDGPFLSKDDFRQRTKATKTVIDLMSDLGLLGDLPESNQLSLFDFA
ncbi:MAG: PolC-type DNA polymerase III [Lachnospiraceae bacterium]|nr:PolC-type DNA polymerase III [Lachnospiraceae bacterium]